MNMHKIRSIAWRTIEFAVMLVVASLIWSLAFLVNIGTIAIA
jgi:hypothetical protein